MQPPSSADGPSQVQVLSGALKAIRKARRMRPSDVARAMAMPLRSYEHFEAGRGRLNLDRLLAFGDATDSDPFAILAAVIFRSPAFALRAVDNKLAMIVTGALQEFNERAGDDLASLEPRLLIEAFTRVFGDLEQQLRKRDTFAEDWLAGTSEKLAPRRRGRRDEDDHGPDDGGDNG